MYIVLINLKKISVNEHTGIKRGEEIDFHFITERDHGTFKELN